MVLLVTQAVSCFLHHLGENMDRKSVSYSVQGSSSLKRFKAFNALGAIAFSFGDAMLPEIQVSDLPNYFRLLLRPFSLVLYIFNIR